MLNGNGRSVALVGVSTGFKKEMEISGVGYRAAVAGNVLKLSLGYSHEVNFEVPKGVTVATPKPTEIVVEGIDQQLVGRRQNIGTHGSFAQIHPRFSRAPCEFLRSP